MQATRKVNCSCLTSTLLYYCNAGPDAPHQPRFAVPANVVHGVVGAGKGPLLPLLPAGNSRVGAEVPGGLRDTSSWEGQMPEHGAVASTPSHTSSVLDMGTMPGPGSSSSNSGRDSSSEGGSGGGGMAPTATACSGACGCGGTLRAPVAEAAAAPSRGTSAGAGQEALCLPGQQAPDPGTDRHGAEGETAADATAL